MRQSTQTNGAKGNVDGTITSGATWNESFEFSFNNLEIVGADTSTWKFLFKHCDGGAATLTLTSGAEITVTQNVNNTIFAINCLVPVMQDGDYQADFAQHDASGNIIHWLSGIVTFEYKNLGF